MADKMHRWRRVNRGYIHGDRPRSQRQQRQKNHETETHGDRSGLNVGGKRR
jgi:hypothetical protein